MEANLCKNEQDAAQNIRDFEYLKRKEQLPVDDAQNSPFVRQVLSTPDHNLACSEEIEEGFLYEIDHSRLPPKTPIQLKAIRAVMVAEKTELNVSVRFPSILSLRKYFERDVNETCPNIATMTQPVLDEQFIMGLNLAGKVLVRRISPGEFSEHRHLKGFWLIPTELDETSISIIKEGPISMNDSFTKGTCYSALKCAGLVHWAVRKRVSFIGRHRESPQLSCCIIKEEKEKEDVSTEMDQPMPKLRKRKREKIIRDQKLKSTKRDKKTSSGNGFALKSPKDRWSSERYKLAEEKILEIMKAKGAVFGNPMLRPALRLEARKHIGDTGLLDHLLKHMASKVAPGGTERFRRRHNADGAMEYWLESADLVKIRKEAGVQDPYWTPPLGWKPGDSPSQDPICARELKLLREEMENLKRDVEELRSKRLDDDEGNNLTSKSSSNTSKLYPDTSAPLQEIYKDLEKRKSQLEEHFTEISNSLKGMQDEIARLNSILGETGKSAEAATINVGSGKDETKGNEEKGKGKGGDEEGEAAAEKAAKRQRLRSGFRICKPQGTFLWPNMAGGSHMSPSPQALLQVEDLLMVPTPPSASSATSTTTLPSTPLHPRQTSPVKPLAERRAVSGSISSVVAACQDNDNKCASDTTLQYHHLNYATGFCGTTSSTTAAYHHYQRRHVTGTTTTVPRTHSAEEDERSRSCEAVGSNSRTTLPAGLILCDAKQKLQQQHQHQQARCLSSSVGRGAWLALATPSPAFQDLNQS